MHMVHSGLKREPGELVRLVFAMVRLGLCYRQKY